MRRARRGRQAASSSMETTASPSQAAISERSRSQAPSNWAGWSTSLRRVPSTSCTARTWDSHPAPGNSTPWARSPSRLASSFSCRKLVPDFIVPTCR